MIDRREFLKHATALRALCALPLLHGCEADEPLPDGVPFSLWQRIREALAASPDHLTHAAQRAVASGDIETIFAFVRDNIALRPWTRRTYPVQIDRAGYAGKRAVLRSGVGTAREKAELLQALLAEAGVGAEIVDGDVDTGKVDAATLLFNQTLPQFAPDKSLAPLDEWLDRLNIEPVSQLRAAELDPAMLDGMAARLLAAIPAAERQAAPDWADNLSWLPLVRIEQDGSSVFLNPNVPAAVVGEHYCTVTPNPSRLQTPVPTPKLKATLSIARRAAPKKLEPLLEGSWAAGDLIGRRLQLRFLPTDPLADLLPMPLSQVRSLLPVFTVAGSDVSEQDAAALGVAGSPFTRDGDVLPATADTEDWAHAGGQDIAAAADVASVDVVVNASAYPRLHVAASLRDASGAAINGLPPAALAVNHGGRPINARLAGNQPKAPRIAFALDFSNSLDERFRGAGLAPLIETLCRDVLAKSPGATFKAGAFTGRPREKAVEYFTDWLSSSTAVADSIRQGAGSAPQVSAYFPALAAATNSEADLVVLVTDADGSSSERPEFAAAIAQGCPAVIVGVPSGSTKTEDLDRLAQLSGGHLYYSEQLAAAADTVVELAVRETTHPYEFDLDVAGYEDTAAAVQLTVPAASANGVGEYERPATNTPLARAITGLYLTLEFNGKRVTRRLAGYPLVSSAVQAVTDDHVAAVDSAFFGRYDLSIEASAPTAAAALDDIVTAALSCQSLVEAAKSRDEETILAATQAGFDQLPPRWLELNSPLPQASTDSSRSFQAGYRVILFSDKPTAAGHYERTADILPFHNWRTITRGGDAFAANLRHTLQLSLLEAENYPTSTFSRVGSADYELYPSYQVGTYANGVDDPGDKRIWQIAAADRGQPRTQNKLLLPKDSSRHAYWEIDTYTGAVLGLLMDASGGASAADTTRTFTMLAKVIDAFADVMSALDAAPPAFAVWVALEKAKLEHLRRATIAIILMDGTYSSGYGDLLADQIEDFITSQVRGTLDDALGGALAGYSEAQELMGWHDRANQLWGAISGAGS